MYILKTSFLFSGNSYGRTKIRSGDHHHKYRQQQQQ